MDNEELANMLTALSNGQLPELQAAILDEAARRWSHKPGQGYSEAAQRIKMEKDLRKRERRAAKLTASKSLQHKEFGNETSDGV